MKRRGAPWTLLVVLAILAVQAIFLMASLTRREREAVSSAAPSPPPGERLVIASIEGTADIVVGNVERKAAAGDELGAGEVLRTAANSKVKLTSAGSTEIRLGQASLLERRSLVGTTSLYNLMRGSAFVVFSGVPSDSGGVIVSTPNAICERNGAEPAEFLLVVDEL